MSKDDPAEQSRRSKAAADSAAQAARTRRENEAARAEALKQKEFKIDPSKIT